MDDFYWLTSWIPVWNRSLSLAANCWAFSLYWLNFADNRPGPREGGTPLNMPERSVPLFCPFSHHWALSPYKKIIDITPGGKKKLIEFIELTWEAQRTTKVIAKIFEAISGLSSNFSWTIKEWKCSCKPKLYHFILMNSPNLHHYRLFSDFFEDRMKRDKSYRKFLKKGGKFKKAEFNKAGEE